MSYEFHPALLLFFNKISYIFKDFATDNDKQSCVTSLFYNSHSLEMFEIYKKSGKSRFGALILASKPSAEATLKDTSGPWPASPSRRTRGKQDPKQTYSSKLFIEYSSNARINNNTQSSQSTSKKSSLSSPLG